MAGFPCKIATVFCILLPIISSSFLGSSGYGGSCRNTFGCESRKNLKCLNKTCVCDPDTEIRSLKPFRVYKSKSIISTLTGDSRSTVVVPDTCVVKVGHPCDEDHICAENTRCGELLRCVCSDLHSLVTDNGYCTIGHHKKCNTGTNDTATNTPCNPGLVCTNGECKCSNHLFEVYNEESGKCERILGVKCDATTACHGGAFCTNVPEELGSATILSLNYSRCQCDFERGLVDSLNGMGCDLAYGQNCGSGKLKCDTIAGLVCKENECRCQNELDMYEHHMRKCGRILGAPCKKSEECIEFAICVQKPYVFEASDNKIQRYYGRCACEKTLSTPGPDGSCIKR